MTQSSARRHHRAVGAGAVGAVHPRVSARRRRGRDSGSASGQFRLLRRDGAGRPGATSRVISLLHRSHPHLALKEQCPIERQIMPHGVIVEIPELGGLRLAMKSGV
jgi:hypothetical protein